MSDNITKELLSSDYLTNSEMVRSEDVKSFEKIKRTIELVDSIIKDTLLSNTEKMAIIDATDYSKDTASLALLRATIKLRSGNFKFWISALEIDIKLSRIYRNTGYLFTFVFGLIWYFQLQRPQDRMLRIQQQLLELELMKKMEGVR